jgi:hypothetical protein
VPSATSHHTGALQICQRFTTRHPLFCTRQPFLIGPSAHACRCTSQSASSSTSQSANSSTSQSAAEWRRRKLRCVHPSHFACTSLHLQERHRACVRAHVVAISIALGICVDVSHTVNTHSIRCMSSGVCRPEALTYLWVRECARFSLSRGNIPCLPSLSASQAQASSSVFKQAISM